MDFQDFIVDAIDRVLSLDFSDDVFGQAVNDHAKWMVHANHEETCGVSCS